jgi:hypothetical protein
MRTPIIEGRDFTEQDERQESPVAIINEAFARKLDPGMHVVGKRITPKYFKIRQKNLWVSSGSGSLPSE